MGGAFGSVDDVEFGEWVTERFGQLLNLGFELSVRERKVLVEEWSDERRVDGHEEQDDDRHEQPDVNEKVRAAIDDDPLDSIDDWHGDDESN